MGGKDNLLAYAIVAYLRDLAQSASGENVYRQGTGLLRLLGPQLSEAQRTEVARLLPELRRVGNIINPPKKQAADAVSLELLERIWVNKQSRKLRHRQTLAIEVLTLTFATTSRTAEILALRTSDVEEDGRGISIRTKTSTATYQRHFKRVTDSKSLFPTQILRRRRQEAILNGRSLLFSAAEDSDTPLSSSDITGALKQAMRKMGITQRVTAHSGRKGAAVEALIAGASIVSIQALGVWKCVDSLQAYVGKAVRERFSVLDIIESPPQAPQKELHRNSTTWATRRTVMGRTWLPLEGLTSSW